MPSFYAFTAPALARSAQLLKQFLLAVAEPGWKNDSDLGVEIAPARAVEVGHSLSRQTEGSAVLGQRWNVEHDTSAQGRDLDLSPQDRFGQRDRYLFIEVVPLALETLVRTGGDDQVEVAVRSAVDARLPLAGGVSAPATLPERRSES